MDAVDFWSFVYTLPVCRYICFTLVSLWIQSVLKASIEVKRHSVGFSIPADSRCVISCCSAPILDRSGGATAQYPGGAVAALSTPGLCRGSQDPIGEAKKDKHTQWRLMEMAKDSFSQGVCSWCWWVVLWFQMAWNSSQPPSFGLAVALKNLRLFTIFWPKPALEISVVQQSKWWHM